MRPKTMNKKFFNLNLSFFSTTGFFLIFILLNIIWLFECFQIINLLKLVSMHKVINDTNTFAYTFMHDDISILQSKIMLVYFCAAISFLIWIYSQTKKLQRLTEKKFEFYPGLAVAAFIIPFFNLYWPSKVFKQLSHYSAIMEESESQQKKMEFLTLGCYIFWVLFVTTSALAKMKMNRITSDPNVDLSRIIAFYSFDFLHNIITIVSAILSITFVIVINKRYKKKLKNYFYKTT